MRSGHGGLGRAHRASRSARLLAPPKATKPRLRRARAEVGRPCGCAMPVRRIAVDRAPRPLPGQVQAHQHSRHADRPRAARVLAARPPLRSRHRRTNWEAMGCCWWRPLLELATHAEPPKPPNPNVASFLASLNRSRRAEWCGKTKMAMAKLKIGNGQSGDNHGKTVWFTSQDP